MRQRAQRLFATTLAVVVLSLFGFVRRACASSPNVVISQVYGGGGNTGATYTNDFIELFNRSTTPINLSGWSLQYAASGSTGAWSNTTALSGTILPGQYFLVAEAKGTGGTVALPTPDVPGGSIAISSSAGKVLLANTTVAQNGTCPSGAQIVDLVGFGGANCAEGSPAPTLTNTTAALRLNGGCVDSDNNASDFTSSAPTPRNSGSPTNSCAEAAPSVASTTPASGAVNVPPGSTVSVTFSEPVNLSAGAITVECPAGNVLGANGALSNVTGATITPSSNLPTGTLCQIKIVATGVSDVDTNDPPDNLAADFAVSFTTASATACTATDTPIGQIQGRGTSAALTGTQTVQGVVVGDYEFPGSGAPGDYLRGFFVQNAPGTDDGDPLTSDGIFVFDASSNLVSVGQIVQVTGSVQEFDFASTGGTVTEMTNATVEVCGGTGTITPTPVTLPLSSPDDLERYESMLVTFPQQLFVTEHFQLERFGLIELSGSDRLPQPTNILEPGPPALAQQAANDLNRVFLDDDLQNQDPDPIKFGRGGLPLSASNTLRGGDSVQGVTGVLTQSDATPISSVTADTDPVLYRVRPFGALNGVPPSFQPANPRPNVPPTVAGKLKIAGMNLLNYFNTFGTGACTLGVGGPSTDCRGADNATEFTRQSQKTVQAALGTGADILVVSELENDGYGSTSAIQDVADKLNAATAPGTWTFIDADARTGQQNALGVDAIRVAMFYKPARVSPIGQTAVANTGAFGIYQISDGAPIQRSRPALAQAFEETGNAHGRVVLVGNHLKSKGSGCADNVSPVGPDPDTGDGQGNWNLTRKAGAEQLATWLAGDPTHTGEARLLILGDMNSYAMEDPIQALRNAGYQDLIDSHLGIEAYSYAFDGQWGYLDHALASQALVGQVAGVVEWHINADEPNALDYNTDFKSGAQLTSLYAVDPFRASDHDPVIVGVNLAGPATPAPVPATDPFAVWTLALLLGGAGAWASRRRTLGRL